MESPSQVCRSKVAAAPAMLLVNVFIVNGQGT